MGFKLGELNCGPSLPSLRIEMLKDIENTDYDLTVYDFIFWENSCPAVMATSL